MSAMSRITNIAIVAWDKSFIDKFAAFTLPCLLSDQNLPALTKQRPVRLLIYTDRASYDYFRNICRPLEQYADCYFHIFDETIVDGETIEKSVTGLSGSAIKHEIDRRIQFHAIDKSLVSGDQETLFIINQDLFISNGSLSYAQARMDAGADAVLIPLLRLSLEASIELPEQIANSGPDGLSAWRLCDRFPQILHPVSQSFFVNSPEFSTYPTAIFWPADQFGWLARAFFPYTLALRPRADCRRFDSTIDYDYALNLTATSGRAVIPENSNQAFVLKVTTEDYLRAAQTSCTLSKNRLAHFVLAETNRAHRKFLNQPFRIFRSPDENEDHPVWKAVEAQSLEHVDEMYRFLEVLKEKLPKDSPETQNILKSHFGDLSHYLSPMRRAIPRGDPC